MDFLERRRRRGESVDNYIVVRYSDDGGETWSSDEMIVDLENLRVTDSILWVDPLDRLWIFWYQTFGWYDGRGGVWGVDLSGPQRGAAQASPRLAESATE